MIGASFGMFKFSAKKAVIRPEKIEKRIMGPSKAFVPSPKYREERKICTRALKADASMEIPYRLMNRFFESIFESPYIRIPLARLWEIDISAKGEKRVPASREEAMAFIKRRRVKDGKFKEKERSTTVFASPSRKKGSIRGINSSA